MCIWQRIFEPCFTCPNVVTFLAKYLSSSLLLGLMSMPLEDTVPIKKSVREKNGLITGVISIWSITNAQFVKDISIPSVLICEVKILNDIMTKTYMFHIKMKVIKKWSMTHAEFKFILNDLHSYWILLTFLHIHIDYDYLHGYHVCDYMGACILCVWFALWWAYYYGGLEKSFAYDKFIYQMEC